MAKVKVARDDEWYAKRVFIRRERNSRKTYNVISSRNRSNAVSSDNSSRQVMIKVTSSCHSYEHTAQHLNYISRNGKLEILDSDGNTFRGKEENLQALKFFNRGYKIPSNLELRNQEKRERRETFNIVFSMGSRRYATTKQIRVAMIKTMQELYPDNKFMIAMHDDTDNPHCHIILKVVDDFGRRTALSRASLKTMRETYARELRSIGIEAYEKERTYTQVEYEPLKEYKSIFIKNEKFIPVKKHKAHHYRVVDFGEAHFNFDVDKDMSYYVRYRSTKGKDIVIWAKDLGRVVEENKIRRGEFCRFAITDEERLEKLIYDKKTDTSYKKIVYKKSWDVSIEDRAEKDLHPLKEFHKNTYSIISKPIDKTIDKERVPEEIGRNFEVREVADSDKIDAQEQAILKDKAIPQKKPIDLGKKVLLRPKPKRDSDKGLDLSG